ncbi:hypothetical protein LR48_Vigan05g084800 [Vigna angularis]|uniref:Uncharacterized protein n=1 Tax=Phaseolus angularis TaxID=3914 RepID=A0A0L9UL08_PHAAN|nr:hypothetical protein LR48_Vigan05g084800 [Vigna angularis]
MREEELERRPARVSAVSRGACDALGRYSRWPVFAGGEAWWLLWPRWTAGSREKRGTSGLWGVLDLKINARPGTISPTSARHSASFPNVRSSSLQRALVIQPPFPTSVHPPLGRTVWLPSPQRALIIRPPFPTFVRLLSNERSSFSLLSQRPFINLLDGPFGYHHPNKRSSFSLLSQRSFIHLLDGPFGYHLPNERSLFGLLSQCPFVISPTSARHLAPFPNVRSSTSWTDRLVTISPTSARHSASFLNVRSSTSWTDRLVTISPTSARYSASFPNVRSSSLQRAFIIQPPFPTSVHPPLGRTVWLPSPQRALVIRPPFPTSVRHLSNERSSFSLLSQRPFIHLLDGPFGYHLPNERSSFNLLSQHPFGHFLDRLFGDHLPNERSLF